MNKAIAATDEQVERFKKRFSSWAVEKVGVLAKSATDSLKVKSCQCCTNYSVSLDVLMEERESKIITTPSKRNTLPSLPTVAHHSINIWSKPTSSILVKDFMDWGFNEEIPGTKYYEECTPCKETGKVGCPQCNQQGKLKCGDCSGNRIVDCPSCNGYGAFNCNDCGHTGTVEVPCRVCSKGNVACNGCGGLGYHYSSQGNKIDCKLCNGSGDDTCRACGGRGSESRKCTSCINGEIDCRECKTQGKVTCKTCDLNGLVTCSQCQGQTLVTCSGCAGEGGQSKTEAISYRAKIYNNNIEFSQSKEIFEKFHATFVPQHSSFKNSFSLDELLQAAALPELTSVVTEIHTHVNTQRPSTVLLERFETQQALVLSVDFEANGQPGKAYYDLASGHFDVYVDPLKNSVENANDRLTKAFKTAMNAGDFSAASKVIDEAKEAKLLAQVNQWTIELNNAKNRKKQKEIQNYIMGVQIPTLFLVPIAMWFVAGFFASLNLVSLLVVVLIAFKYFKSVKGKVGSTLAEQKKIFKAPLKSTLIRVAILLGAFTLMTYFSSANYASNLYRNAMPVGGSHSE